jgi:hypothetical protein
VIGMVRDTRGEQTVRAGGGTPVLADLFDPDSLIRAARVRRRGHPCRPEDPCGGRSRAAGRMNDRIRRLGTQKPSEAAVYVGAHIYLQQSAVWVIRPRARREL